MRMRKTGFMNRHQELKQLGLRPKGMWGPFARTGEKLFISAARKSGKTNFCLQFAISLGRNN